MNTTHSILLVAVVAGVTATLRFLPFLIFRGDHRTPAVVQYLGRVLPYAIMGMLVVYCLKNVTPLSWPYALPEGIAAAVVVLLHLWRRNTLLSIVGGTAVYILLIQFVFS